METSNDSRDQQSTVSSSAAAGGSPNASRLSGEEGSSPPRKSLSPNKSDESSSFERLGSEAIEGSTLVDVIKSLRDQQYDVLANSESSLAEGKVKYYFDKDYRCEVVHNRFCPNYPPALIIPVAEKENGEEKVPAMDFDKKRYTDMIGSAVHARTRSRYPVPVILFGNKFICRAGTDTKELENSDAYDKAGEAFTPATPAQLEPESSVESVVGSRDQLNHPLMEEEEVLVYLRVDHICDLIVDYNEVFKAIINYIISETRPDEVLLNGLYGSIKLEDMPFPGCEFFKMYSEAGRNPEGLKFDWSKSDFTRRLILTDDHLTELIPELDAASLKERDIVKTTKMYLKIMLAYLVKYKGLLVQCISGWDRTPLFISLLRLSLWADNVIHQSLEFEEIAYLTVTYDWVLFGHAFPDRWAKKEVMHFCFNFLSYISTDDFSITRMFQSLPAEERENRQFPRFEPGRRAVLDKVRQCVLDVYNEHIIDREWAGEKQD